MLFLRYKVDVHALTSENEDQSFRYFTIMIFVLLVKYNECLLYSTLGLLQITIYSITFLNQRRRLVLTGHIILLEIQVVDVEIAFMESSSAQMTSHQCMS